MTIPKQAYYITAIAAVIFVAVLSFCWQQKVEKRATEQVAELNKFLIENKVKRLEKRNAVLENELKVAMAAIPAKTPPPAPKPTPKPTPQISGGVQKKADFSGGGVASWYDYSLKGLPNYSKSNLTAASRDYPRGTHLEVCREDNPSVCVVVRVNDYGPQLQTGRAIDLSSLAFTKLEKLNRGLVRVKIRKVE